MLELLEKEYLSEPSSDSRSNQEEQLNQPKGLSSAQAAKKLDRNNLNTLEGGKKKSAVKIFMGQFHDFMVMILLVCTVISALMGEFAEALTIISIVVINAALGFVQEYKTEKTLEKLKDLTAPNARVYRNGNLITIESKYLVEGDIIEVAAGDSIPADGVIIENGGISCDESSLTGENLPVKKSVYNGGDTSSLNLNYMCYMGTSAVKGNAVVRVTAIGKDTQMGKVSSMLNSIEQPLTPLQKKLGSLGKTLGIICIGVCVVVFAAGLLRGEPAFDMFMTAITIAIAAIPEGLPATVTIALAMAVRRMFSANALVKKLHSVETLGCASVICTDKTGTVTQNKMMVTRIAVQSDKLEQYEVGENEITKNAKSIDKDENYSFNDLLICGAVCNEVRVSSDSLTEQVNKKRNRKMSSINFVGDPTEVAVVNACAKARVYRSKLGVEIKNVEPFESDTRRMSVVCRNGGEEITYIKGAVDVVLLMCSYYQNSKNEYIAMSSKVIENINQTADSYAKQGLRVLAFMQIRAGHKIFLGLMGMQDPPRVGVKESVLSCHRAGIDVKMITGDHKLTAESVAQQVGILYDGKIGVTGAELDRMSDEQLEREIENIAVFSRVTPAHKLKIVKALKAQRKICAMTGDGINDAPAIKEADIGVAMGESGTDVTKQAADVILCDDNFKTLVTAVAQGRTIYSNIRKLVRYLISCNIGEVVTMFVGIIMGMPMVLLPAQILLVNLVTDSLPAIALGLEPTGREVMNDPPRKDNESFFADNLGFKIAIRGLLIGLCTLASFVGGLKFGGISQARSCALVTLIASQLIHVFECKSFKKGLFGINIFDNIYLLLAVLVSAGCVAACFAVPVLSAVFCTVPLGWKLWTVAIGCAVAVPFVSSIINSIKK